MRQSTCLTQPKSNALRGPFQFFNSQPQPAATECLSETEPRAMTSANRITESPFDLRTLFSTASPIEHSSGTRLPTANWDTNHPQPRWLANPPSSLPLMRNSRVFEWRRHRTTTPGHRPHLQFDSSSNGTTNRDSGRLHVTANRPITGHSIDRRELQSSQPIVRASRNFLNGPVTSGMISTAVFRTTVTCERHLGSARVFERNPLPGQSVDRCLKQPDCRRRNALNSVPDGTEHGLRIRNQANRKDLSSPATRRQGK